uniref:Putative conserved secreted protein n=1 Tax=Nyssomyia neivai TaxID=330878 RepID=A0A1L8DNY0_9DIPT
MVCVPCFIIPVLLFVWHRFIQPYVLRFWNPWAKKDAQGNVVKDDSFPFTCKGGSCPFPAGKAKQQIDEKNDEEVTKAGEVTAGDPGDKKND